MAGRLVLSVVLVVGVFAVWAGPAVAAREPVEVDEERVALELEQVRELLTELYAVNPELAGGASFEEWAGAIMSCAEQELQGQPLKSSQQSSQVKTASGVLDDCLAAYGGDKPAKKTIGSYLGLGGLGHPSGRDVHVDCGTGGGADPRLSGTDGGTPTVEDHLIADLVAAKNAKEADKELTEVGKEWLKGKATDAQLEAAAEKSKKAHEKVLPPKKDGGERTDPNADEGCLGTWQQLSECERNGWKRGDCQRLWARLCGKSDPGVTDPSPESLAEREPSTPSRCEEAVDPEVLEQAVEEHCGAVVNPGPEGEACKREEADAPCGGQEAGPETPKGAQPKDAQACGQGAGDHSKTACTSPEAQVGPDDERCLPQLQDPHDLGLQEAKKQKGMELLAKAGVHQPPVPIPQPGTGPGGGGPQPKSEGETAQLVEAAVTVQAGVEASATTTAETDQPATGQQQEPPILP